VVGDDDRVETEVLDAPQLRGPRADRGDLDRRADGEAERVQGADGSLI
jgi:hypothetical protein